jgi:hypothetical protein
MRLPVHALITTPTERETVHAGDDISMRGTAWGGSGGIAEVLVQIDGGIWSPARLGRSHGPYTRLNWEVRCALGPGMHEIACRAIDGAGEAQPDLPPRNVQGYANNAVHRVTFAAA